MNLGLCIANLLRRYPAVQVPGIGVFRIVRMPASYDRERSVYLPPTSRIELTEEHADFFPIVNYLQTQRGVDEATAMNMLDKAVRDLVETITRKGRTLLDGVGYLVADGAALVFQPFDTGAMDVTPLAMPPESVKETAPLKPVDEIATATEDVVDDGEADVAVSSRGSHTARWIVVAALVLLVSAAGTMWYYKSDWFNIEKKDQLLTQTEQEEKPENQGEPSKQVTAPADTVADSTFTDPLHAKVADSVRADTVVAPISKPPKPAVTYEIIVGSFATMAQARKYVAEMKAKGYDLQALDSRMPGNRKKISWGSYATEEEAYRELARVQKNFEPGAWIAKVENE